MSIRDSRAVLRKLVGAIVFIAIALSAPTLPALASVQGGVETRTLVSGGVTRSYLVSNTDPVDDDPPLVIVLHGDGGNSAGIRASLPIETSAQGGAVFAYPKSHGNAFEYWSVAGRQAEAAFVTALIADIDNHIGIDTSRVYLAGFSGGATMANALGCYLGADTIRGLGIHSGSLWGIDGDIGYTGNGGFDCDMPATILVWGKNDNTAGVDYATGQNIRTNHRATQLCEATSTAFAPAPCIAYDGCNRRVNWCAIDGLGHSVWNDAAQAMWNFFAADAPAGPGDPQLWADGFEGDGAAPPPTRWVGGYYVGYERALYPIADVDFSAITHLMVGRLTPVADGTLTRHFDIDNVQGPIWAQAAIDAAHAANRKAILMIGGAGEVEGWRAAADDATRAAFVANLLDAVDDFGADGLDIDWEPLPPSDYDDFIALAQALRTARPTLELTLPLGWVNTNFAGPPGEAAFLQTISPLFDQINIMTYEMAAAYDGWYSWFASPLHGEAPNTPSSTSSSIDYYLGAGVPAAKLGVGIGFYGNCFRNVTQPRVPVALADFVVSDGAMSYRNIATNYVPAMTYTFDAAAQAPWLGSAAAVGDRNCNFVTYENPASIAAKGAYAVDEHLGGTIIWTISQGHIPGLPAGQRDPLLDAVREAFLE